MTNDFSGGLRGLRPPATFFATFGLRWVSQLYDYRFNGFSVRRKPLKRFWFVSSQITGLKPGVNESCYGPTASEIRVVSSLIRMRLPMTSGFAQVGLDATVYSATGE
jgi:hypothetical protein